MQAKREKYGLITSITMIIGICIGSGIFFKSDNVLAATGGSVPLGILVFAIAAISIVFGGLAISELASRTDKPGGIIAYSEEFVSRRFACCIGWFQTLVYYPALIAVVSWVIGVYFCILFAIPASFPVQLAIGIGFYAASYLLNTFAPKAGGAMQNITTFLKLVPLVVIAVLGLAFGDPLRGISQVAPAQLQTAGWLSAIGPVAFSYDGWIVSTSISHEIRDAKRNLPKALVLAPLLVMLVYILYFTGVASLLPANEIVVLGDDHVAAIARNLLGDMGARVILIFIIISVVGTVNGLVLGFIRQPYSLALDGKLFPGSKRLARIHPKWNMPLASSLLAFSLCLFWSAAHYFTHSFDLLPNSDVSEISIALNYLSIYCSLCPGVPSVPPGPYQKPVERDYRSPFRLSRLSHRPFGQPAKRPVPPLCGVLPAGDSRCLSLLSKTAPGIKFPTKKTACTAVFSLHIPKGKLTPHLGPAWSWQPFQTRRCWLPQRSCPCSHILRRPRSTAYKCLP